MDLQNEFAKEGNFLFRYRSYLPLVILVIGIGIYIYQVVFLKNFPKQSSVYELICFAIAIFGLAIRVYTLGFVAPKTSGRNTTKQIAKSLNTTGIYSMVRHPLYLGNYFMWLGIVLFIGNFWFALTFSLAYWLYYERIMYAEEQFLKGKFGQEYTDWANITPAFIPSFKNFVPPQGQFNWRKVLVQEKNGLLAIFLILAALEAFEILWTKELQLDGDEYFFSIGLVLSVIFYFIFKYIKIKDRQKV
ncbi:MAG: methyltransferase family protein [Alphaproteobacteria bacterium]